MWWFAWTAVRVRPSPLDKKPAHKGWLFLSSGDKPHPLHPLKGDLRCPVGTGCLRQLEKGSFVYWLSPDWPLPVLPYLLTQIHVFSTLNFSHSNMSSAIIFDGVAISCLPRISFVARVIYQFKLFKPGVVGNMAYQSSRPVIDSCSRLIAFLKASSIIEIDG